MPSSSPTKVEPFTKCEVSSCESELAYMCLKCQLLCCESHSDPKGHKCPFLGEDNMAVMDMPPSSPIKVEPFAPCEVSGCESRLAYICLKCQVLCCGSHSYPREHECPFSGEDKMVVMGRFLPKRDGGKKVGEKTGGGEKGEKMK